MNKQQKLLLSVLSFIFFAVCIARSFDTRASVNISQLEHPVLHQAASHLKKLIKEPHTDFYIANFKDNQIPDIKNPSHNNIIWLGSSNNFNINKLKNFNAILASTLDLSAFLRSKGIPNQIHPLFIDETSGATVPSRCVLNPKLEGCYYIVIGTQPQVISALQEQNLAYKNYPPLNSLAENFNLEKENISGIITNNSTYSNKSLDIEPFYLLAINNLIPILSDNIYYGNINTKNIFITHLFADTINYYTYKSDIKDFLNCLPCRLKNAKKAKFLVTEIYSAAALEKHIQNILEKRDYEPHLKNVMTIVSPTYAGIYNNGDYWIAKDLEESFSQNFREVITVFPLSHISYIGDTYLYIRGGIPLTQSQVRPNTVSLYYLLFPSFADELNTDAVASFIDNIKPELKNVDTVVVASKKMEKHLRANGVEVYYVPQFTNTKKFYPDYEEDKKSEVLFVGNYLPYRTAVPTILKTGLPLTVYGNGWEKGIAKAPYIDNRILRKYYSSAKIVLNDTREGMKKFGFIINRIFDATACETLVISDYMPEIEEVYGDSVPMWKSEEELVALVKYYLAPEHEEERKEKAKRAREITLKNFTADRVAKKFQEIIREIKQRKNI